MQKARDHLLAAPDKFRGTLSATAAAAAICDGARAAGWTASALPVSDGGEGLLDCVGGANRFAQVSGPLGAPVRAGWRLDGDRAVVEMATASGLALVEGRNDPLAATTAGTGELLAAAFRAGARTVIVGAGGSATTDGGRGAVDAVLAAGGVPDGVELVVATDVDASFADAAPLFAPQKGADAGQVATLQARLDDLARDYAARFGVEVRRLPGSAAAGGLAGGLAALGAVLRPGFDVVAQLIGLAGAVDAAGLVVTGEGRLDATSLLGKAPVGVARLCRERGRAVVIVAGDVAGDVAADIGNEVPGVRVVSLTDRFGAHAARTDAATCLSAVVEELARAT